MNPSPSFLLRIRISKGYRLTLRLDKGVVELRRVGTHDILRDEG